MFSIYSLQILDILDLKVLDFYFFTELACFECFSTWCFIHAIIPVCMHFSKESLAVELGYIRREMRGFFTTYINRRYWIICYVVSACVYIYHLNL